MSVRLPVEGVVPESGGSRRDSVRRRFGLPTTQKPGFSRRVLAVAVLASLCLSEGLAAQVWREVTPSDGESPFPRRTAGAVLDADGQRMILFAGRGSGGDLNDLWSLDLATHTWTRIETPRNSRPSPRFTPNTVYDQRDRRVLMWAGRKVDSEGSGFFNDVWDFSLDTGVWTELAPTGRLPERRYGNVSIFDPITRSMVTFAGFTDLGRFNDTWRFAVDSVAWQELTPSTDPGQRCLHIAVHDTRDHRMIIFGGQRGSATLADIWSFDLATDQWRELTPEQGGPGGRRYAASVYDSRRHGVVVIGGGDGEETKGDVWFFDLDSESWLPLITDGSGPEARDGAVAVYVESQDRVVLFGGTADGHQNDLWSLEELNPVATAVGEPPDVQPGAFALEQNYPNPFNSQTAIVYTIPNFSGSSSATMRLSIHDLLGQEIRTLVARVPRPGHQVTVWDGKDHSGAVVSSGIYLYRLEFAGLSSTRKVLFLQ